MQIDIQRNVFTDESTISKCYVDGTYECDTLEDVVRPAGAPKVHGKTAIPAGRYRVLVTMSNRFKRPLPLLVDVPGFEGIRIHPGNTAENTDGCILPGKRTTTPDFVGKSRDAFDALFAKIEAGIARGEKVWLTIS